MNEPKLLSIGIPTRNRAGLLERAAESLLKQRYSPIELLISDNASDDDTPRTCDRLRERHANVNCSRTTELLSPFENFSRVLKMASGEYFMWASDDDLWDPLFAAQLIGKLESDPNLVLAASEAQYVSASGAHFPFFPEGASFRANPAAKKIARIIHVCIHNYGNLLYGIYRRNTLLNPDGTTLVDGFTHLNEIPLFIQVAAKGRISVIDETLFYKTAPQAVYLQAAREYGFHPSGFTPEPQDSCSISTLNAAGKSMVRLRRLIRSLRSVPGTTRYHLHTFKDCARAIHRSAGGLALTIAAGALVFAALAFHLIKTAFWWPLQDFLVGPQGR